MEEDTSTPTTTGRSRGISISSLLGSLRFALAVVLIIALACVAGTLIPQGPQVAKFLERRPEAQRTMEILDQLGFTHVFFSRWFVTLLCFLSASLLVCTFRRCRALSTATGSRRIRVIGSLVTHASMLLILAGGVIRALWGEKGYIEFHEGESVSAFMGQRNDKVELPFEVRLANFTLEFHGKDDDKLFIQWPEMEQVKELEIKEGATCEMAPAPGTRTASSNDVTYKITIERYLPDFIINMTTREVSSRSDMPNNPAIQVSIRGGSCDEKKWLFAKFPEFGDHMSDKTANPSPFVLRYVSKALEKASPSMREIKDYKSTLQIVKNGTVLIEKIIEVNDPLSFGGYTLYQSGYNPADLTWTSLQVVRDPGVGLVYTGFSLMMIGLAIVFWLVPSMEQDRNNKGGLS